MAFVPVSALPILFLHVEQSALSSPSSNMPDAAPPTPPEALALQAAVDEATAIKELSRATGRIGRLLGASIVAGTNANPTKTEVALTILGEKKAGIRVTSPTKVGALLNVAGLLNTFSDLIEQRLASRHPPVPPVERKTLPTQDQPRPVIVKRIGG